MLVCGRGAGPGSSGKNEWETFKETCFSYWTVAYEKDWDPLKRFLLFSWELKEDGSWGSLHAFCGIVCDFQGSRQTQSFSFYRELLRLSLMQFEDLKNFKRFVLWSNFMVLIKIFALLNCSFSFESNSIFPIPKFSRTVWCSKCR